MTTQAKTANNRLKHLEGSLAELGKDTNTLLQLLEMSVCYLMYYARQENGRRAVQALDRVQLELLRRKPRKAV